MAKAASSSKVKLIDNPHAPDIYADGMSGLFAINGNVRITFENAVVDHSSSAGARYRVVIGRLVMPMAKAEAMARELLNFLDAQKVRPGTEGKGTSTLQ